MFTLELAIKYPKLYRLISPVSKYIDQIECFVTGGHEWYDRDDRAWCLKCEKRQD